MQYLAIFIVPKTVAIFLSVFIFPRLRTRRRRHNFLCSQENILFDAVQIYHDPPPKYAYVFKIPNAVAIFINLCFPKITHTRRRGHDFYVLKRLFCWMPYKYAPIPLPNIGWKNLRRDRRASRCAEACLATECGCPFS